MRDGQNDREQALAELRQRLTDGLATARLDKTQLARRAGLGRTTVSEALSSNKPVPSPETVAALARALPLPVQELLTLQRTAAQEGAVPAGGPGRPIGDWAPHELEVHPAEPGSTTADSDVFAARSLPGYVPRDHDRVLDEAVRHVTAGRSRMVVLVGTSSTGKTRACWEAVQPLADRGWRLWHPFDPTRAEAALEDLHHVGPRTVVWLNEAQHYLGNPAVGERIAAAVHRLLVSPERGPVLVLGTLWPEYAARYTALPTPDAADPHSRTRELLAGPRLLTVPDAFDAPALAAAAVLAEGGDRLLADALTRARADGRITQDLAGAPELLNRYRHASPAAKAVLEAAMDARRLGVGLHLPQAFLTDAATDYLNQSDYDQLTDDWAERAYAELSEPVHGKQVPLRRTAPRPPRRPPTPASTAETTPRGEGPQFRLADYLEQHGRTIRRHLCPPASLWHAAHTHLIHSDDLHNLAGAARTRHRLQWAHHLCHRAASYGNTDALYHLSLWQRPAGDPQGGLALIGQAADHGDVRAISYLVKLRLMDREEAEVLLRQAADHGNIDALYHLAELRVTAGDPEGAEVLLRQAADHGNPYALCSLILLRETAGDREGAETLAGRAADHGSTAALRYLAELREEAGDREGAETVLRRFADRGNTDALYYLAELREKAGDREGAEALAGRAADHGSTDALLRLAELREEAGDREGAEALLQKAADQGDSDALLSLAELRETGGDRGGAEALLQQAADHGNINALYYLAELREKAGDREGAESLAGRAADHGGTYALRYLAKLREDAGDQEGAEVLLRQAADHHGDIHALHHLAGLRERAGDREGAEVIVRQAADHGDSDTAAQYLMQVPNAFTRLWPNGLDPDGTPTPPWPFPTPALRGRHVAPDAT
ncbi:tetratricopeptide repeat protein [Streptomyces virginiae]|uniref:tetratricopeptide repeat protein n=1 Tax=Streptomyces virginiae TaxID=1961 RepID=UPI003244296E